MGIDKDLVYSIKEASALLDVHPRKLNRLAVKNNLVKTDNRYLFSGAFLIDHFNLTSVKTSQRMSKDVKQVNDRQLDLQVQSLEIENERLKAIISDLKQELSQYDVAPGERIEVFTNEDYDVFEQRLRQWFTLQKDLEHKDELFNAEKKSLSELLDHYKNQFEYQKKQSTKILEMHQTLIDTIQKQSNITIQRNIIEASEKDVIKKDTWKPGE